MTVAYCRVSTDEQAAEGFSIEGQADKLRAYALLHDLGEVTVLADPGLSGKDMKRSGLQQVLAAVEAGHASHVLVWNLSRLSRNLGDLILLADTFGEHGVALHSVSENLDLSSASGRMFYNILGSFAQYFREHLGENVKMGNDRAVSEGRWINRPPTGYDLIDRELVHNDDAPRVREVFRLRAEGRSYRVIEERTGIRYSTARHILCSEVYLGKVLHNGDWFPGRHEAVVTDAEFRAAQRALGKGVQPASDVLTGRVRCGLCQRRMAVAQNGKGSKFYLCRHRGAGCAQSAHSTKGLARAAVLGLSLLRSDERLLGAIRRKLASGGRAEPSRARRPHAASPAQALERLSKQRRALLQLHYDGKISADLFHEEESRLALAIEVVRFEASAELQEERTLNELEVKFEEVAALLASLDIERVWDAATERERRILVEQLVESITVLPDHLEVKIAGTPPLNVLYSEVGLKGSEIVGVGGGVPHQ